MVGQHVVLTFASAPVSVPASPQLRWITAIALPFASATLLTIAVGAAAVIGGVSQVLRLTGESDVKGKLFRLLSGLLYLGGGIWVLAFPIESEVSLTLFVGFLLAFEGVMELAAAATSNAPARGLVLLDGIVTAVLGGSVLMVDPQSPASLLAALKGLQEKG